MLKLTSTLSGKTDGLLSAQPPPLAQSLPLCSPLMTPLAGNAALYCDEALAMDPLAARATLSAGMAHGFGVGVGVGVATGIESGVQLKASTSTMRLAALSAAALTTTLILSVVTDAKLNLRF